MDFRTKQEKLSDLYRTFGPKYPYAADAVGYYIFGDKKPENILRKAYHGAYGRGTQVIIPEEVSQFMLDMECSWEEMIQEIEDYIRMLPTADGGVLSDYY